MSEPKLFEFLTHIPIAQRLNFSSFESAMRGPIVLVFNNWGIITRHVELVRAKPTENILLPEQLREIEKVSMNIVPIVLQEYHDYVRNWTQKISVPASIGGICLNNKDLCKVGKDKWTCTGCGKSYLPKSYADPKRCVVQEPPSWYYRHQTLIDKTVANNGGLQKTYPLTTKPIRAVSRP